MESVSGSALLSIMIEDTLLLGLSNSETQSGVAVSIEFLLEEAFDFDILPNLNLNGASLEGNITVTSTNQLHIFGLKNNNFSMCLLKTW